jgi:hypothetical protein
MKRYWIRRLPAVSWLWVTTFLVGAIMFAIVVPRWQSRDKMEYIRSFILVTVWFVGLGWLLLRGLYLLVVRMIGGPFKMGDRQADEDRVDVKTTAPYRGALQVAVVFQVLFGILSAFVMDFGVLAWLWCSAMVGYWVGFAFVRVRGKGKPTKVDLFVLKWGFVPLFVLAMFLFALLVSYNRTYM